MSLRFCVGIDLGSTTTKAVILDEDRTVLGRGITNSRSNYDVACAVALEEALIQSRFSLIQDELVRLGVGEEEARALLGRYELAFREQQYRVQLTHLRETLDANAKRVDPSGRLGEVIGRIVDRMEGDAGALFEEDARRKSDFFRDLAGASYLAHAEQSPRTDGASFDMLVAAFDKSILTVENSRFAVGAFDDFATAALGALRGDPGPLRKAVDGVIDLELEQVGSVGTGYGRALLPFDDARIRSEILCHGLGAHHMFPGTRTVLDIGGQDTKAIQVDVDGIVTSFQMNDRCAAGCGRYLGYIADEMNLGLHELGPLAQKASRSVRINSTCTVFAGAELRERLALGEKREDILAGLHRAIVLRAMSLLARSGGVSEEFTFTGGVAKNVEAVAALRKLIDENYGELTINISPESIYTGALGAALFAWHDVETTALAKAEVA